MKRNVISLKEIDEKLERSFIKMKRDLIDLKKAKSKHAKDINYVNLRKLSLEKRSAEKINFHNLLLKVNTLENDIKKIKKLPKDMIDLENIALTKKEFNRKNSFTEYEINKIKINLERLRKSKIEIKDSRLKKIEDKILNEKEIRDITLQELRTYMKTKDIANEMDKVKKELLKLYKKMGTIRRDILNFRKSRFFSNTLMLLSLVNFAGAGVALYLNYISAANFLGIEGFIILLTSLLIKVITALRR